MSGIGKPRPITIAGGGLAGLALGISLRRREIPVTVWEAGAYPRHRVCGEFISGRGQEPLRELLGLSELNSGATPLLARTVAFSSGRKLTRNLALPEPAFAVSRHKLDALLANQFERMGGELRVNQRWTGSFESEGLARATGRKAQINAKDDWRFLGLKCHARNVQLAADLELHLAPGGYVGLCAVEQGIVNVCGLFRSRGSHGDVAGNWRGILSGTPGSALAARLRDADWLEDSFCAVAGLSFREPENENEFTAGDAIGMIPPFTGNGMSIAFESAVIAGEILVEYSMGRLSWSEALARHHRVRRQTFSGRLRNARLLQALLFRRGIGSALIQLLDMAPTIWPPLLRLAR